MPIIIGGFINLLSRIAGALTKAQEDHNDSDIKNLINDVEELEKDMTSQIYYTVPSSWIKVVEGIISDTEILIVTYPIDTNLKDSLDYDEELKTEIEKQS